MKIPSKIAKRLFVRENLARLYELPIGQTLGGLVERYGADTLIKIDRECNYDDPDDIIVVLEREREENDVEYQARIDSYQRVIDKKAAEKAKQDAKDRAEYERLKKKFG